MLEWIDSAKRRGDLVPPSSFASVGKAREFIARFLPEASELHILGLGINDRDMPLFIRESGGDICEPTSPYLTMAIRRQSLDGSGEDLGWEPLCLDWDNFCSWLCNYLEQAVFEDLGIRPNTQGFIASEGEAYLVADYCNRPDIPSEPGWWAPWLIRSYAVR